MARSTTPTRRPASSSSVCCRVRLSAATGARAQHPRQPNGGLSSLPSSVVRLSLPATTAFVSSRGGGGGGERGRRECACSPTTHPGSFRCARHRSAAQQAAAAARPPSAPGLLHGDARRSAMANPLVRIAAVEGGDHVRRAVASLIRPSSHHRRRRAAFLPRPSRLSAMSAAAATSSP
ncbi:uncharacterized protein LOC121055225 [Oryza brachyantha]|uniref:uncharacterized protein LOC121055225 n=1 Tax=Oryza brachyantha TaxID=4533 RepID=UPI001ADC9F13|nr:uncharacterized protein LOC121055225 [Oryza brachyantha]